VSCSFRVIRVIRGERRSREHQVWLVLDADFGLESPCARAYYCAPPHDRVASHGRIQ
jgi:hypothetical protein